MRRGHVRIDDASDPRLAVYAGVRTPALLLDSGLVVAEGRLVVRRLLASRRVRVVSLLLNEAAGRAMEDVLDWVDPQVEVYVAPRPVITAVTGFDIHRGCLAIAQRPAGVSMATLLTSASLVVVLERVADADNVGGLFRNAEAFGADAVLLSPGCSDPFYRKAIRTSSGATLLVPSAAAEPWPQALDTLRAAGFVTVALMPDGDAMAIGDFASSPAARGRVALIFGTEGDGLTRAAQDGADVRVRIPMHASGGRLTGALDSLNIAAAAGIALHRLHEVR